MFGSGGKVAPSVPLGTVLKAGVVNLRSKIRKEAKESYDAVEAGKINLQKMLTTLREVRTKKRSIDNNAKRKKQVEILKILKPFVEGGMPNEIMPWLCSLMEEGNWDSIEEMKEKMDSTDVFHAKEDNQTTQKGQQLHLVKGNK